MIPRYSRPEMAAIFAPETRLRIWLDVELDAAAAMAELGQVPAAAASAVRAGRRAAPRADHRSRPDRGDRGGHAPRRDRVPDPSRGGERRRGALPASRADLVGPARHRASRSSCAQAADLLLSRSRPRARGAAPARLRAQGHALHRPHARHARRADSPSASSSPASSPSSRATGGGSRSRAPRSRPARSRARSAPTPTSTRGSRRGSPRGSASPSSRSRPR